MAFAILAGALAPWMAWVRVWLSVKTLAVVATTCTPAAPVILPVALRFSSSLSCSFLICP